MGIASGQLFAGRWNLKRPLDIVFGGQAESRVMDAKTLLILALGVVVLLALGFCALPT